MSNMKIYMVYGHLKNRDFNDKVVARNVNHLFEIIQERYGEADIKLFDEISAERVDVKDLTCGDLIRLIKSEIK